MCASGLKRHWVQNMVSESFLKIVLPVFVSSDIQIFLEIAPTNICCFVFVKWFLKKELMILKIPCRLFAV